MLLVTAGKLSKVPESPLLVKQSRGTAVLCNACQNMFDGAPNPKLGGRSPQLYRQFSSYVINMWIRSIGDESDWHSICPKSGTGIYNILNAGISFYLHPQDWCEWVLFGSRPLLLEYSLTNGQQIIDTCKAANVEISEDTTPPTDLAGLQIADWLRQCNEEHSCTLVQAQPAASSLMPTRLLDLNYHDGIDDLRLGALCHS